MIDGLGQAEARRIPVLSDPEAESARLKAERARLLAIANEPLPQTDGPVPMYKQIGEAEHITELFDGEANRSPLKAPHHILEIVAGVFPDAGVSPNIVAALEYELVNYDNPADVLREAVARNVTAAEYAAAQSRAIELKQAAQAAIDYEITDPAVIYSEQIARNMPAAAEVMAAAGDLCRELIHEAGLRANNREADRQEPVFPVDDWHRVSVGIANYLARYGYTPATYLAARIEVMRYIRGQIEQQLPAAPAFYPGQTPAAQHEGLAGASSGIPRADAAAHARPFDGTDVPRSAPAPWVRLKKVAWQLFMFMPRQIRDRYSKKNEGTPSWIL